MPPRALAFCSRFSRSIMTLGFAALAVTGCRSAVRTEAEPSISGLIVRNSSQFDVNVYALPAPESKPVWLATVPAAGMRTLSVYPGVFRRDRALTVRTQAIGSSRSWTSRPITIDDTMFAMLEIVANGAGDCSESQFYAAAVREIGSVVR